MSDSNEKFQTELRRAYTERKSGLRAIARRGGNGDAEDIVQEAFLRVVETYGDQNVRKVDNLLSRVVRSVAIDNLKLRTSRRARMEVEVQVSSVNQPLDPERGLMGSQRLRQVMETIDNMPARRREVFLLHRMEDLTYPQIARHTGTSIKAVEKHIRLALKQLAESLD